MKGLFIVFEGADGCGKSTQLRFLSEYLESLGVDVVLTREPGGSPVAEKIREILLDKDNSEMTALTEALLYAAARAEHVRQVIKPAVDAGKVVLCDRFVLSSIAYQGYGRQLDIDTVWQINKIAIAGYMPDVTVFINVPPERAFERMNENKEHDRLEREHISFHRRVFDGFVALSKEKDVLSVDAQGTKYETHEVIKQKLDPILKNAGVL
ncbi:MAG: dTMP kinase [Eubacteriales bacterium]|nr:dTMP kinase [Eubacteriales bacterium]